MNCEAIKELLWAYLEKETTAEETEKIEEHLKHCADCRGELNLQKEIMDSLRMLPDAELPKGYHAELMQKLKAEAAPNTVPFPQKQERKKKQTAWRQWGMIAAAVLVVAAAGDGMLEMRESRNAAVSQMKAMDTASSEEDVAESIVETDEFLTDIAAENITDQSGKKLKKDAAAGGAEKQLAENAVYDADVAAVPETASETEEVELFSVARSQEVEITDKAVLLVTDISVAMAELQKVIAEAGGHEEGGVAEHTVIATIPMEKWDDFVKAAESIGALEWTQKDEMEADAVYRAVEIQLQKK